MSKTLCKDSVSVISRTLIWRPFLLQRENTSDLCPTVLYFPRIKCIFYCEDWHVNQWKDDLGWSAVMKDLLLIILQKSGWHLRACAKHWRRQGLLPGCNGRRLGRSPERVAFCREAWASFSKIHWKDFLIFERKPKPPCLKITKKPLSKHTKAK